MNIKELSAQLGITERRVQQLAKINILPKVKRGDYDLDKCRRQYQRYLKNTRNPESFAVSIDDLAACLSIDVREVRNLIERGIICYFDLEKALKSYFSHVRKKAQIHRAQIRTIKTQQTLGVNIPEVQ